MDGKTRLGKRIVSATMFIFFAFTNTATAYASYNIDPRYNVSCEPGRVVVSMDKGVMFECRASDFTKAYQLHSLKSDAVAGELAGLGLVGYLGWFLNVYFDKSKKIAAFEKRKDKYEKKAKKYYRKGLKYKRKANRLRSRSKRKRYYRKARRYYAKAKRYSLRVRKYQRRIEKIVEGLDRRAPSDVNVSTKR